MWTKKWIRGGRKQLCPRPTTADAAAMRSASVACRAAAELILTTDRHTVALHALSARSIVLAAAQHQSCMPAWRRPPAAVDMVIDVVLQQLLPTLSLRLLYGFGSAAASALPPHWPCISASMLLFAALSTTADPTGDRWQLTVRPGFEPRACRSRPRGRLPLRALLRRSTCTRPPVTPVLS